MVVISACRKQQSFYITEPSLQWCREQKSARGARAADVAERAPPRPGGPVQLTSKALPLSSPPLLSLHFLGTPSAGTACSECPTLNLRSEFQSAAEWTNLHLLHDIASGIMQVLTNHATVKDSTAR